MRYLVAVIATVLLAAPSASAFVGTCAEGCTAKIGPRAHRWVSPQSWPATTGLSVSVYLRGKPMRGEATADLVVWFRRGSVSVRCSWVARVGKPGPFILRVYGRHPTLLVTYAAS